MTPADTMRAAVEALEDMDKFMERGNGGLLNGCSVHIKARSALSLLRSALADDALRMVGAAGPLGDPDVLASPLPNEVLQLLNHIEDVIGDEAWARIDAKLWNAVTRLAAGVMASDGSKPE